MSETPERKVLKEMIQKLKAKLIQSVATYSGQQTLVTSSITEGLESIFEQVGKVPEETKPFALLLYAVVSSINTSLTLLIANVNTVLADMNLYNETLEQYSTELDKTLTGIFEGAKKMAEEELKKQEELRKRKPSGMTV